MYEDIYTLKECDDLLSDFDKGDTLSVARAGPTQEERDNKPFLNLACKLLEHRAKLEKEISEGLRSPGGELNVRV